jgi:uncharacterized membrane protein
MIDDILWFVLVGIIAFVITVTISEIMGWTDAFINSFA